MTVAILLFVSLSLFAWLPSTHGLTAECAMQFFATGMGDKSVSIVGDTNTGFGGVVTGSAKFGADEAEVRFSAPYNGGELQLKQIVATFNAPYMGCRIDQLVIGNISLFGFGTGQCLKVTQNCPSSGPVSSYGNIYVDLWCTVPQDGSVPGGTFRADWFQATLLDTC